MSTLSGIVIGSLAATLVLSSFCSASPVWYNASDGQVYLIEPNSNYNWLQASDECLRRGLQLVDIDSKEKNEALISLLKAVFGKSRNLWLGYHDELNTANGNSRPFYSAATGEQNIFNYWNPNEPNNQGNKEHCAHIWDLTDFHWNDKNCEDKFGYICEENHISTKYDKIMQQTRMAVHQKNTKLSSEFTTIQTELEVNDESVRIETDNRVLTLKGTSDEIFVDLKKSIEDILIQKQYLDLLMTNMIHSFMEMVLEKERLMAKETQGTRQNINEILVHAGNLVKGITSKFSERFTENRDEINELLFISK